MSAVLHPSVLPFHLVAVVLEQLESVDCFFHPVTAADLLQDTVVGVLNSDLSKFHDYQHW